jgi:hypothetical protein
MILAEAKMIVDKFDDAAEFHAASRADKLRDKADLDGVALQVPALRADQIVSPALAQLQP